MAIKIGIIGAGKAGLSFASYLFRAGFTIRLWDHSPGARMKIQEHFGPQALSSEVEIIEWSDWLLVALPDTAIEAWVSTMVQRGVLTDRIQGIMHLSGALGIDVFHALPDTIGKVAIHPMRAFAVPDFSIDVFKDVYFGLTANQDAYAAFWRESLPDLAQGILSIEASKRVLYHAAAVVASNLIVPTLLYADRLYLACEIDPQITKQLVYSLARSAIENYRQLDQENVLTGPLVRGDQKTIESHLQGIQDLGHTDILSYYAQMSLEALNLLKTKALGDQDFSEKVANIEHLLYSRLK